MKKFAAILLLLGAVSAFAQRQQGGFGGGFNIPGLIGGNCLVPGTRRSWRDDTAEPRDIDRTGFVYGRLRYNVQSYWRQGDIPWHHDYPDGDTMLPDALERLTKISTNPESYQIVDVDSKDLFKYPFVYMSEVGYLDLQPKDLKNLRQYLDRGGFVFVDDFRGSPGNDFEMENFIVQLRKLYPDRELKPVTKNHEIFHTFFEIDPTNMLPPYKMNGQGDVQFLGISDDKNRLMIMVDYNNDLSEYWQALDVGSCSMNESSMAVQLGINYVVYAMTH